MAESGILAWSDFSSQISDISSQNSDVSNQRVYPFTVYCLLFEAFCLLATTDPTVAGQRRTSITHKWDWAPVFPRARKSARHASGRLAHHCQCI
jgi:hypothetical protein